MGRVNGLMLGICDHYALEYSIQFNADKSKCILFGPCNGYSASKKNLPNFLIGGSVVDYVDSWPRLGHIISNNDDDRLDIINRCNSLCTQINNILCYFKSTSIIVQMKLFISYCNIHYRVELRDLGNKLISDVCVMWHKVLK